MWRRQFSPGWALSTASAKPAVMLRKILGKGGGVCPLLGWQWRQQSQKLLCWTKASRPKLTAFVQETFVKKTIQKWNNVSYRCTPFFFCHFFDIAFKYASTPGHFSVNDMHTWGIPLRCLWQLVKSMDHLEFGIHDISWYFSKCILHPGRLGMKFSTQKLIATLEVNNSPQTTTNDILWGTWPKQRPVSSSLLHKYSLQRNWLKTCVVCVWSHW